MKKVHKDAIKDFKKIFEEFGDAISEIFNDPKLKKEAKNFGNSAVNSVKTFVERFKDEDVKRQFRQMGKAANRFGKKMEKIAKDTAKKLEKTIRSKTAKAKKSRKPCKKK